MGIQQEASPAHQHPGRAKNYLLMPHIPVLAFVSTESTVISTQTSIHRCLDPVLKTMASDKNLSDQSAFGAQPLLSLLTVSCNSHQQSISGNQSVQKTLLLIFIYWTVLTKA